MNTGLKVIWFLNAMINLFSCLGAIQRLNVNPNTLDLILFIITALLFTLAFVITLENLLEESKK